MRETVVKSTDGEKSNFLPDVLRQCQQTFVKTLLVYLGRAQFSLGTESFLPNEREILRAALDGGRRTANFRMLCVLY